MKKKKIIILILQILLVIGFGLSFITYVKNEVKPVNVYVFSKDLPVNTEIKPEHLQKITIPAKAVTPNFVLKSDEIIGKCVNSKVYAGQYVIKQMLVEKKNIDPFESMDLSKFRKISLPINFVDGLAGNIKRGDKVDLLFVGKGEKDNKEFVYSKVFLQDIYVYSVNTEDGFAFKDRSSIVKGEEKNGKQGEQIDTVSSNDRIASITLVVTLNQAEELMARLRSGEVRLLGRFDDSKSYNTLGYIMGDYSKVFTGNGNAETSTYVVNP